jgi:hypothetical protein
VPWYIGNRHIDEDLVVPFFADHIRALNESFDRKIYDVRKSLFRQFVRYAV